MSLLVLFTVAIGATLAAGGVPDPALLVNVVFGTGLVAAGASACNQYLERHSDGRMRRTENRPLPAGRMAPLEVLALGVGLGLGGVVYLALSLPQPLAAAAAAFTYLSYVLAYTPLKGRTSLNTLVGAVPGAMPPVIGWLAVRGTLDAGALTLFLILFLWQVPHFLAIAWVYRDDYARAGLVMLPVVDEDGSLTGRQMVNYGAALLFASLVPLSTGAAGPLYGAGAALLGLYFLWPALRFRRARTTATARQVLRASLLYLPALLALLWLDGATRSWWQ
jgi:protoheme IX farnesyltransferase